MNFLNPSHSTVNEGRSEDIAISRLHFMHQNVIVIALGMEKLCEHFEIPY